MDEITFTGEVRVCAHDVLATEVDGELVLLHPEKETYFGLNETGVLIWEELETPTTVEELESRLTSEYEISDAEAARTTRAFLDRLWAEDLIEVEFAEGGG